ncbi:MAG: shikimate dehydrogenase [Endomicrobium sp.]|jgi:shikimate dehydrogenase|nr:shikimate dehydrogenase [Endomicrobium sp.]
MINTETKLFAILGSPIKHSLSPQMHNEWFKKMNLNCVYLAFELDSKYLDEVMKSLKLLGFCGANITIPYKIEIMEHIDFLDEIAERIGSVNTLSFKDNKVHGYNTDYLGFSQDLLAKKIELKNKNVLVIGAGGVARAIVYALKNSVAAGNVYISNRTLRNARLLASIFELKVFDINEVEKLLPEIDFLVNTSSCGLKESDVLPFNVVKVKNSLVVYDLIFNKDTPFVTFAKKNRLKVFTGEGMLIRQGACGFKIWTGKYPDIKIAETLLKEFIK